LTGAGFAEAEVICAAQTWRVSDPTVVVETIMQATVRASATLRAQTPAARASIERAIQDTIEGCARDGYYEIPMPAVVASALKPTARRL
jgi:hypothetical protein